MSFPDPVTSHTVRASRFQREQSPVTELVIFFRMNVYVMYPGGAHIRLPHLGLIHAKT